MIPPEMKIQPGILPTLDLKNYASGKQAECVVLNSYEEVESACVLKHVGEGKQFTNAEIDLLVCETKAYRQDLARAGVLIPENHRMIPYQDSGGSWKVFMVDEFIDGGGDIKMRLKNPLETDETKSALICKIIDFIRGLPGGDIGEDTAVLGDFKPDNFVEQQGTGKVFLIDYFGPKRRDKDGFVYPYLRKIDTLLTRDVITFLCGDRRGEIARLLAIVHRDYPNLSVSANEYALQTFAKVHPAVTVYLEGEIANEFSTINSFYQIKEDQYWVDKV